MIQHEASLAVPSSGSCRSRSYPCPRPWLELRLEMLPVPSPLAEFTASTTGTGEANLPWLFEPSSLSLLA